MNVPKGWVGLFWLVALVCADIDSKEYFCGKKLVRTLTELCSIYNNPTFVGNRIRRQIVEECCRIPCTRRYLVQYYCKIPNSSITDILKMKPEPPRDNKTHLSKDKSGSEDKNLSVGTSTGANKNAFSSKPELLASNHDRIIHGKKYSCKCRKRRAKVP